MIARLRSGCKSFGRVACGVALVGVWWVTVGAPSSALGATIVLGDPLAPTSSNTGLQCGIGGAPCTLMQTALTEPGAQLAAPVDGVIDSANIDVVSSAIGLNYFALRVLRPAGGGQFTGVGTSQHLQNPTIGINNFVISPTLTVKAGDMIALDMSQDMFSSPAVRVDSGGSFASSALVRWGPALGDGTTAAPTQSSTNDELRFNASLEPAQPEVGSLSPASGPTGGGTPVTLTGDHMIGVTAVSFGSATASSFTVVSDTQITAVTPAGVAGAVPVTVSGPGGVSAVGPLFTYVAGATSPQLSVLGVSSHEVSNVGREVNGRCAKPSAENRHNKRCKRPIKLRVSYTLSRTATVTFTLKRAVVGRRVNGKCVKPTAKNQHNERCTRLTPLSGAIIQSGQASANSFIFNGTIGGHKLGLGTYELTATAADGTHKTATFRIIG